MNFQHLLKLLVSHGQVCFCLLHACLRVCNHLTKKMQKRWLYIVPQKVKKKKKKLRASSIFYALLVLFLSGFFIVGGAGIYYVASILQDAPELDVSRFLI